MACKTSYELHHQFPKMAEESGFTFNTHRPRVKIDWNKIKLIDIDSLIKDRKFYIIEEHLNDLVDCVFESEFDVRILDEGVSKMFRLAQLALEYQQFCRYYLDRSVYILREEIASLSQALDTCKKELQEKDEDLRKFRRRNRNTLKSILPNDNIAAMIINSMSQKTDNVLTSPLNNLLTQYNKCKYCDKVFLNLFYLKSHVARRHVDIVEVHDQDVDVYNVNNKNPKLSDEVTELKNKIKELETLIESTNKQINNRSDPTEIKSDKAANEDTIYKTEIKYMKDASVDANNEEYIFSKIEEWKKQDIENQKKEMNVLKNQILETLDKIKELENQKTALTEPAVLDLLNKKVKEQDRVIADLKDELKETKLRTEKDYAERNKEAEKQIAFWENRAELQSKQYESLLQKLNKVAKDAKEAQALAKAEKERAYQLKVLLQKTLNSTKEDIEDSDDNISNPRRQTPKSQRTRVIQTDFNNSEGEPDQNSLDKLHRKAQELLQIGSFSSSSSENSADFSAPIKTIQANLKTTEPVMAYQKSAHKSQSTTRPTNKAVAQKNKLSNDIKSRTKPRSNNCLKTMTSAISPSPTKVVRAKINEQVNNRLISAGVDPLKSRLKHSIFQKQRLQLQLEQELKSKKNPAHDKVRHTILAYLDTTTSCKKEVMQVPDYSSPIKNIKPLKNLTSVISNVKTKALALVKMNETNTKEKQKLQKFEMAKRARSLLKTPPDSPSTSPIATKRTPMAAFGIIQKIKDTTSEAELKNTQKLSKNTAALNKPLQEATTIINSRDVSIESDEGKNLTIQLQSSKSIDKLVKSPARRPASATAAYNHTVQKYTISDDNLMRAQSVNNLLDHATNIKEIVTTQTTKHSPTKNPVSSDDGGSFSESPIRKNILDEHVQNNVKQTKSVLKNASSTSSLNKKKVLFDMDAIQMKSVSASPSQSLTEKSDGNEKYELGLVNLDGEEWDVSSIENEPLKNDTKIQNLTRTTSPKIAQLKEKIESQLARRTEVPSSSIVGGVDVLSGVLRKSGSIAGSNTSLGSSILDDSESVPIDNHMTTVRPKKVNVKEDSDIDISEFSIDGIVNKNESF